MNMLIVECIRCYADVEATDLDTFADAIAWADAHEAAHHATCPHCPHQPHTGACEGTVHLYGQDIECDCDGLTESIAAQLLADS